MRRTQQTLVFLIIAVIYVAARLLLYPQPAYTIGTNDTPSYVNAAALSLPQMFTSNRPPTVPLLYRLFTPPGGYVLSAVAEPANTEVRSVRERMPGFDRVGIAQMLTGMAAWLCLAWVLFKRLRHPAVKVIAAAVIMAFALSPQVAEWDAVLLSESLHISLFALVIAGALELLARILEKNTRSRSFALLAGLWTLAVILWQFTRDNNLYGTAVIVAALIVSLVVSGIKRRQLPTAMVVSAGVLLISLIVHNSTLSASRRWEQPLMANILNNVLPYDTRTQFFADAGMPNPDLLKANLSNGIRNLGYRQDPDFVQWLSCCGMKTYQNFLLHTPLWAVQSFLVDMDSLFTWAVQPYYSGDNPARPGLLVMGNLLHSTSSVILLAALLLALYRLVFCRDDVAVNLVLVGLVILAAGSVLLFTSYHGDFYSRGRHAVSATLMLRLDFWLLLIAALDFMPTRRLNRR